MVNEFEKIGVNEKILKALEELNFNTPTEIQEKAIPLVLKGKDIIAGSATGSGKTLAFGAGIIQHAKKGNGIQALILTPTRELAEQICDAFKKFSKYAPLNILSVYGGISINPQIDKLRNTDVVVGTPGRILDHISRGTIDLSNVNYLVLDEADRMLDMGFIDDVRNIIGKCKKQRQTLLFSATIPPDINDLCNDYMDSPVEINAECSVDPKKLAQVYYDVPTKLKFSLLVNLVKSEKGKLVMIFCNSRLNVNFVEKNLKAHGVDAIAIHGGFSQQRRSNTLKEFNNNNKAHVLICTDVAARGLDIPGVSHVYNYDIPKESKQYVHRIGRTARAGKEGKAINLLVTADYDNFTRILRDYDLDIEKLDLPEFERVRIAWLPRSNDNRSHGNRNYGHNRGNNRNYKPRSNHRLGGNNYHNRDNRRSEPKPDNRFSD